MFLLHRRGLPAGTVVGGYKVLGPLGAGGFGAVHKVEKDGQLYALKLALLPEGAGDEKQTHERALRELLCLLLLEHPGIVGVEGHGRHPTKGGHLYVVQEYVEGWTLAEWLVRTHPTAREVIRVFIHLTEALEYMHGRGVFHRDLKLSNVLIRKRSNLPVLIDFGAAEWAQAPALTGNGLPPGTERQRSPEALLWWYAHGPRPQARYEFRVTDELFALGAMLYDALTDPRPTQEHTLTELNLPLVPPTPPEVSNPRIPAALASLVTRLLARQPSGRPENMEAVRRELVELEQHQGREYDAPVYPPSLRVEEPAPRARARQKVPAVTRRRRLQALAAAGAVAVLATGTFLSLSPEVPQPGVPPPQGPPTPRAEAPPPPVPSVPSAPPETPPAVASPLPSTRSNPAVNIPSAESPPRKSPRATSPECTGQTIPSFSSKARFRQWCQSQGVLGTLLAVCAGCTGAQLYPPRALCPDAALKAMRDNGLECGHGLYFNPGLDPEERGEFTGVISSYRPKSIVPLIPLPPGTRLYGRLWATPGYDEKYAVIRIDRVKTPDNREFPVCIEAGYQKNGNLDVAGRPEAGAVEVDTGRPAQVTCEWHDPAAFDRSL
jgi:serine/threonine protein kinase